MKIIDIESFADEVILGEKNGLIFKTKNSAQNIINNTTYVPGCECYFKRQINAIKVYKQFLGEK